jgi:exopolysaccharide production protein ExoZ
MSRPKAPFFFGIQNLPGFAALYVVAFHINSHFYWPMFAHGDLGVQLFFMISGFVITQAHGADRGLGQAIHFVQKRATRIYPAYMLAFIPVVLIFHFMPNKGFAWHRDTLNIVRNLFLVHDPAQSILGVSWTLIYELMFYLIFCTWVILLRQKLYILLAGWFIGVISNLVFFQIPPEKFIFLSQVNIYFIAGCFIALFYHKLPYKTNNKLLLVALAGFVLCPFLLNMEISILITCFILCVVAVLYETNQQSHTLVYLGNASYSIYLTHLTLLAILTNFIKQPFMIVPVFFLCVGGGLLFYRYIESPVLKTLNQHLWRHSLPDKNRPEKHARDLSIHKRAFRSDAQANQNLL